MLRAIPNKLFGVATMGSSIVILLFMPWLDKSPVRSMRYKGAYSKYALLALVLSFVALGYLGMVTMTPLKQILARICAIVYFAYFLLMPFYSRYEQFSFPPERI